MKRKKSILAFVLVTCFIAAFMSRIAFADFESCYAQESNLICGLEEQVRENRETNTEELNQNEAGNIKMKAVQAKTSTVVQNSIIYELDTINNTAKVVSGSPVSYKITVPDNITVDGKTYIVTSIGPDAFYGTYGQNFKEVSIGSNVTTISANAFGGSLGSVDKIEFEGDVCQSIAADAFDWITLSKNFQLIVYGKEGCMDAVINKVTDLAGVTITYIDPNAGAAANRLQQQINDAEANERTIIEITEDIDLTETITVPSGKDIVMIDDGKEHTISPVPGKEVTELFNVKAGGALTFDSTEEGGLVFAGGVSDGSFQGNIVNVSGHFCLKNAVLKDGKITGRGCGAVIINENAVFDMYGGTIESFTINGSTLTAAVVVGSKGTFNMFGGVIKNNINNTNAYSGGGVLLYTWNGAPKAVMTMSKDAEISGNKANSGGGIYLIGNTDFVMSGGKISGNSAFGGNGGGVCVAGAPEEINPKDDATAFVMENGIISENESSNHGGGIYVNSSDVILKGGRIEKNEAGQHGGGIYVSHPPYELHMYNALITGNTASVMGGGLWFCPTGDANLAVTAGAAVFGNTAEGKNSAGDDFASVGKGTGKVNLADRMLGGGAVEWYKDGAVIRTNTPGSMTEWMETGQADTSVPRFDSSNPGQRIRNISSNEGYALKSVTTESARKLAISKAKLVICENTAQRGGGIGSNGAVTIGNPNEEYILKVIKKWSENIPSYIKQDLTVYLKIGDYKLDFVQLTSDNNWTSEFTGLPEPESLEGLEYAVVEEPVPEFFTPVYHKAEIKDDTITITIENQYSRPAISFPDSAEVNSSQPDSPEKNDGVRTGDSTQLIIWITIMLIAMLGLAAAMRYKMKSNKPE